MSDNAATSHEPDAPRPGRRWLKWGAFGLSAVVVVLAAAFIWYVFIRDVADPFDEGDLDSALAVVDTTAADGADDEVVDPTDTAPPTTEAPVSTDAPTPTTEPPPASSTPPPPDGASIWEVTDQSELGYRVNEILFGVATEAVGRTNQITGALTIDGTQVTDAEFVVDVASISSDESRRDGQFRGRIMSTDEFPTATFTLTLPIELGTEPGDGVEVTTTVAGELTLRGVTNDVTFELTAKQEGERIGVLGSIPVVFADYQIANPSIGGITTEDNGLLEFVLVFEQPT